MARPRMQNNAEYNAIREPFRFDGSLPPDTHPAAIPVGYNTTPKARAKPAKRVYKSYAKCNVKAPCGASCELSGAHGHRYHTCQWCDCPVCHAPERFGRRAR